MRRISQRDLRDNTAAILRKVESGESFTVTHRGQPVARLTPFVAQPRTFLPAAEAATALAGAPPWGERDPLPEDQTRGQRIVGCMAGRATTNLATDELMDLLRN